MTNTFKEIDADGNGDLDREEVLDFLKLYIQVWSDELSQFIF